MTWSWDRQARSLDQSRPLTSAVFSVRKSTRKCEHSDACIMHAVHQKPKVVSFSTTKHRPSISIASISAETKGAIAYLRRDEHVPQLVHRMRPVGHPPQLLGDRRVCCAEYRFRLERRPDQLCISSGFDDLVDLVPDLRRERVRVAGLAVITGKQANHHGSDSTLVSRLITPRL